MTHQIDCLQKNEHCSGGFNTHLCGFSQEIDGKMFIFMSKPRHVTPQIDCLGISEPCSEGFNIHIYVVSQGDRWENVHFAE